MESLVLICCLHGNERYGLEICKSQSLFPFVLANEKALKENRRFMDVDLNRIFPGNLKGNYEEKRATEILERLRGFDRILDLHSSSNYCPLFGIITKPNKEKIEFAKRLGLKRLVIMSEFFASGKSLIDFVKCGISLEVGPHNRKENISEVLESINNFAKDKNYNKELQVLEVFNIVKKQNSNIFIRNFEQVIKGQEIAEGQLAEFNFIPVLVGEEAYGDVLCLATRRIDADNLYKSE